MRTSKHNRLENYSGNRNIVNDISPQRHGNQRENNNKFILLCPLR